MSPAKRITRRLNTASLLFVLLFILLSSVFFSAFNYSSLSPNIESAWQNALASFRHHPEQQYGSNVYYTYGPLATKIVTSVYYLDTGHDFALSILLLTTIFVLCLFGLVLALQSYTIEMQSLSLCLLALCLIVPISVDLLFFVMLIIMLPYLINEKLPSRKLMAVIGLAVLSTYKNNLFVTILPVLLLIGASYHHKSYVRRLGFALISISLPFILFIIEGIHPLELPRFVEYAVQNSLAYGEFMNFNQHALYVLLFWLVFVFYSCAFMVRLLRTRDKYDINAWLYYLGDTWVLYVALRQAITRSDQHLIVFIPLILYIGLRLVLLVKPDKKITPRITVAFFLCALLVMGGFSIRSGEHLYLINKSEYAKMVLPQLEFKNTYHYYSYSYFRYKRTGSQLAEKGIKTQTQPLLADLHQYATKNSLDFSKRPVMGFDNSVFYLPALAPYSYLYSPSMQNFVSQPTKYFDSISMLILKQQPEYLVFWDNVVPAIDNRIASQDMPNTMRYLQTGYHTIASDKTGTLLILAKKSTARPVSCYSYRTRKTSLGRQFTIDPSTDKISIAIHDHIPYKLKDILYKKPVYTLQMQNNKDIIESFRAIPAQIDQGIYIHPWLKGINDGERNYTPSELTLTSSDNRNSGIFVTEQRCY